MFDQILEFTFADKKLGILLVLCDLSWVREPMLAAVSEEIPGVSCPSIEEDLNLS